jgi:geranylgeranyl diphosphate synthase type I
VQLYSQVHDDLREANPDRDGRPTVWWVWGPAQAINAGDGLDALARLALLGLGSQGVSPERVLKAAKLLDRASLDLCEGQYQETQFQEQLQVSRSAYLPVAESRAGALVGCALQLGALTAGADEPLLPHHQRAGRKLGLALQLHRELQSLWGEPPAAHPEPSILNKKKSLPVVHALETAPAQTKRELGALYLQRVLDPKDLPRLRELLDAAGSRQYCRQELGRAKEEARAALAQAGLAPGALAEFQQVLEALLPPAG